MQGVIRNVEILNYLADILRSLADQLSEHLPNVEVRIDSQSYELAVVVDYYLQ